MMLHKTQTEVNTAASSRRRPTQGESYGARAGDLGANSCEKKEGGELPDAPSPAERRSINDRKQ